MRWPFVLLVASACYRPALEESCSTRCDLGGACPGAQQCTNGWCHGPNIACGSDGGIVDTPNVVVDGDPNADAQQCFGRGDPPFTSVCLFSLPNSDAVVSGALGTDDCTQVVTQANGTSFCVMAARNITVDNSTSFTGTRIPLLLATETITVNGFLTVAGTLGNPAGRTACKATSGAFPPVGKGGGGGAGGSSGALGGDGGTGEVQIAAAAPGTEPTTIVRGVCSGGDGVSESQSAAGGQGGGSIYLLAGTTLQINGTIDASGAGGAGGPPTSGGGGGGAGGMIVLDAGTAIDVNAIAVVMAIGAGGGGGGGIVGGGNGDSPTGPFAPGGGGTAGGTAGGGGDGGIFGGSVGGSAATGTGDGGGGGGGAGGIIRMSHPVSGRNIGPPPT